MRRSAFVCAVGLAVAAGAWVAAELLARAWALERLPMWDAAGNGWGAVELWAALADGRLGDFLLRLNAQDKWPFGFSLLLLPFVAWGGGSFESVALLPALAFALVPALLVWAALEVDRDGAGLAAGLLAGALWLTSPLPRALATVAMRETAGAALGVAVLAAYLRARRLGTLGAWRLAAGLLLALLWVKYNYFLLGGAAIGLHAVLETPSERRREIVRVLGERITRRGWREPARWVAIVTGVTLVSLAVGQNPGNFLYLCLVVATVVAFTVHRRSRLRPRAALSRLAPAARGLTELLILPVWIWSLSPRPIHPRNAIAFLRNRPGELPPLSIDSLAFYPRALFEHYLTPGTSGWIVAALAVAGIGWLARRGDPARAVALTAAIGALALTLHPMREDRFLTTVAPILLLLAATRGARSGRWLLRRSSALTTPAGAALLVAALAGIAAAASSHGSLARLERDHRSLTAAPELLPPLTAAAFWASAPGAARVGLLGGLNELSESAVRWEAWRGYGTDATWAPPLRGLDGASTAADVERRLARWLARERPDRVVVVRPMTGSRWLADADFRRYNAWQLVAGEQLAALPGWRAGQARQFHALGLELQVLERGGD